MSIRMSITSSNKFIHSLWLAKVRLGNVFSEEKTGLFKRPFPKYLLLVRLKYTLDRVKYENQ